METRHSSSLPSWHGCFVTIASLSTVLFMVYMEMPGHERGEGSIPKIIHQIWLDEHGKGIPPHYKPWMDSWKKNHPDWKYILWNKTASRQLIADRFPKYLKFYDEYPGVAYRADAVRYFILYLYGGVYLDLDVESLKTLDPWLKHVPCVITREHDAHAYLLHNLKNPLPSTAIMGCRPKHKFFAFVIRNLEENNRTHGNHVLTATGPLMLAKMYYLFAERFGNKSAPHLAHYSHLSPIYDPAMIDYFKMKCGSMVSLNQNQKRTCNKLIRENYVNLPANSSLSNHYWAHMLSHQR